MNASYPDGLRGKDSRWAAAKRHAQLQCDVLDVSDKDTKKEIVVEQANLAKEAAK
jgi:hypothetical protein